MPASPAFTFTGASGSLVKLEAAPESVVTATLDDLTGVQSVAWSIFSTDETGTSHPITPSGVKGSVATLTSGVAGTAGILKCTVSDGTRTYSATAKWYVEAANGAEVGCLGETDQSDRTWHTVPILNSAIRTSGPTPPVPPTLQDELSTTGDFAIGNGSRIVNVGAGLTARTGFLATAPGSVARVIVSCVEGEGLEPIVLDTGGTLIYPLLTSTLTLGVGESIALIFENEQDRYFVEGKYFTETEGAPATRQIIAGSGLTGGGDLSVDRTINVAAGDASITVDANSIRVGVLQTDAQHGTRGGGSQHALAVSGGSAGFMSGTDKQTLDGLASTSVASSRTIIAGAGLTGGGTLAADRTINIVAADASIAVNADSISVGVLQSDAQHGNRGGGGVHATAVSGGVAGFMSGADKLALDNLVTTSTPNTRTITAGAGLSGGGTLASDRTIDIVATDGSISVSADSIAVGVLQSDAQHGNRGGGTTHSVVTGVASGFMSSADKSKLDASTASSTASTLAQRDASGGCGFEFLYPSGSVATVGRVRTVGGDIISACRAAGTDVACVASDASGNVLVGPRTGDLGEVRLRCDAARAVSVQPGGVEVIRVTTALSDFSKLLRIAALDPAQLRDVGMAADGRLRLFVGGAAKSVAIVDEVVSNIYFGASSVGTTAVTRYMVVGNSSNVASTSIQPAGVASAARAVRLEYRAAAAGVGSGTITFTLVKIVAGSPVATALTLTVPPTATTGTATANVSLAAAETIALQVTQAGMVTSSPNNPVMTLGLAA